MRRYVTSHGSITEFCVKDIGYGMKWWDCVNVWRMVNDSQTSTCQVANVVIYVLIIKKKKKIQRRFLKFTNDILYRLGAIANVYQRGVWHPPSQWGFNSMGIQLIEAPDVTTMNKAVHVGRSEQTMATLTCIKAHLHLTLHRLGRLCPPPPAVFPE